MTALVGKFVHMDNGQSYRTGKIIEAVTPELYLVRWDWMNGKPEGSPEFNSTSLVHVDEMLETVPSEGWKAWSFFDSSEAMQEFLAWLNSPSKPAVVQFVKK
jgi:hypothetical protein